MNLPLRLQTLAIALALAVPSTSRATDDELRPIFDGETLEGWKRLGGKASYEVEDGQVVGTTVAGEPNSFLTTEKTYGDFILELEYRVDPKLNSGVQIRSEVKPSGRVFGYQVEIDPSDRAWSGGIYDEARRGWLNPLTGNEPAREAFRQNEWNRYRVVCEGDSLRTWINGVPAADLRDSLTLEGFIGLQVHSYRGDAPVQVRWRDIRLADNGRHEWAPLFDGKTLDGFTAVGGGEWKVEDGAIVGRNAATVREHGHLFLDAPMDDFTARVEYRAVAGNSGLYFRAEKKDGAVGIAGFQAEIDATKDAGGLYETGGRGWVVQPKPEDVAKHFREGEWNVMTVSAHGERIVVHVNGWKSAELTEDSGREKGVLALQLHGGQDMEVRFRKVEVLRKAK